MIWSIIESVIAIFIMYKCCEKFEYKITWLIYTGISTLFGALGNGFSDLLMTLLMNAAVAAIVVWVYYKIYEHCNHSFGKFIGLAILVQIGITLVLVAIGALIAALVMGNGILAGY